METVCNLEAETKVNTTEQNIECFVCKGNSFKVTRVTPELVMMKCKNCSEIHMMSTQASSSKIAFWDSEQLPYY